MKTIILALCGFLATPLVAQTITTSGGQTIKLPDIHVASEATELAAGYAKAFESLERRPISALIRQEGSVELLSDIAKVTAYSGTLRIELRTGITYVINARDVIVISDDTRLKP